MVQPKGIDEDPSHEDPIRDGEPLMSFEGPKFFTKSYSNQNETAPLSDEESKDLYNLLNYYRTRCAEFDQERKEYIDRFASIEVCITKSLVAIFLTSINSLRMKQFIV